MAILRHFRATSISLICSVLLRSVLADQFTNPSNSVTDLTTSYTLGQVVQLAWDTSIGDITLVVAHWGGQDVGVLLSDAKNPGVFSWTVGQSDNIDQQELSLGSNYVLILRSPSGCASAGGWVGCQLQSRAFKVKQKVTTTSTTLVTSASSSSSSSASSSPSPTSTSASASSVSSVSSISPITSASSTLPSSSRSSSDLPTNSTSSTTSSSQLTASAAAATTIAPPSSSPTHTSTSTALSTGTIAGISAAAILGLLIVTGLGIGLAICLRRRTKRRQQDQYLTQTSSPRGAHAPEVLSDDYHKLKAALYQQDYKPRMDMNVNETPKESELQAFHSQGQMYKSPAVHELSSTRDGGIRY